MANKIMKIMIYSSNIPDQNDLIKAYPFLSEFGYENGYITLNSLDDIWALADMFTNGIIVGKTFADVVNGVAVDAPSIEITDDY